MRLQRRAEPRVHCDFDSPSPGQPIIGRGTTSRSGERPSAEAAQSVPAKSWQAACVRHQRIRTIQRTHAAATTYHAPGGQLAWAHLQPLCAVDERANGTDGNGTVPFLSGQKWADHRNCPAGLQGRPGEIGPDGGSALLRQRGSHLESWPRRLGRTSMTAWWLAVVRSVHMAIACPHCPAA